MTETVVSALVFIPLMVLIPLLGKYLHLNQKGFEGARYAVWERTVHSGGGAGASGPEKSDEQVTAEVLDRVFGAPSMPVRSSAETAGNPSTDPFLTDYRGIPLMYRDVQEHASGVAGASDQVGATGQAENVATNSFGLDRGRVSEARLTTRRWNAIAEWGGLGFAGRTPGSPDEWIEHSVAGSILTDPWASNSEEQYGERVGEAVLDGMVNDVTFPGTTAIGGLPSGAGAMPARNPFGEGRDGQHADLIASTAALPERYVEDAGEVSGLHYVDAEGTGYDGSGDFAGVEEIGEGEFPVMAELGEDLGDIDAPPSDGGAIGDPEDGAIDVPDLSGPGDLPTFSGLGNLVGFDALQARIDSVDWRVVDVLRNLGDFADLPEQVGDITELAELSELQNLSSLEQYAGYSQKAGKAGLSALEPLNELSNLKELSDLDELAELGDLQELAELADFSNVFLPGPGPGFAELQDLPDLLAPLNDLGELADLADLVQLDDLTALEELSRLEDLDRLADLKELEQLKQLEQLEELERLEALSALGDLSALATLPELAELTDLGLIEENLDLDALAELAELSNLASLADLADLADLAEYARFADLADLAELADLSELAELKEKAELAELSELAELAELEDLSELEELSEIGGDIPDFTRLDELEQLEELDQLYALEELIDLSELTRLQDLTQLADLEELNDLTQLEQLSQLVELNELAELEQLANADFSELVELAETLAGNPELVESLQDLPTVEAIFGEISDELGGDLFAGSDAPLTPPTFPELQ